MTLSSKAGSHAHTLPDPIPGPEGPQGPEGPMGPQGERGPEGPAGTMPASPTLSVPRVTGRLELVFDDTHDADGKPIDPYTELQWKRKSDGRVIAQIVAHTENTDGVRHDHLSFYTFNPTEENQRRHVLNIGFGNADNGFKPNIKVDDATLIVLKTADLMLQDPATGRFYRLRIRQDSAGPLLEVIEAQQPPD